MSEQVETQDAGGPMSAADLGALVDNRSDEEITNGIKELGVDAVLGEIFKQMATRFLPEKAQGRSAVIQYDVNTPDGTESYQVVVDGGTCTAGKAGEAAKEPTVTLVLSLPDFLRLITGKLNGVQAFMSGKLKIRGDMMLAQTMQGWFDQS